jgi:hypothetical protein
MFVSFNRAARRRAYVILALLPALLFRAGVPVGYMLSFNESGAAAITLCPSVPGTAAPGDHAEHADHSGHGVHHHEHAGHDHSGRLPAGDHEHSQPPCPFGAATIAAAAPPSVTLGVTAPIVVVGLTSAVAHEAPAGFPLLRAQSPRAPPVPT